MAPPCPPYQKALTQKIFETLALHDQGLSEYELQLALAELGFNEFAPDTQQDSLSIFQTHFLLFHHLDILRDRLRNQDAADLTIHCLEIRLRPATQADQACLPTEHDPLRDYYLDWQNMENTSQEDVDALLNQFWLRYHNLHQRPEALGILGLSEPVRREQIKKRFRELARIHHPDAGGDATAFTRITWAMEVLTPL